jgi:hypothetical protein
MNCMLCDAVDPADLLSGVAICSRCRLGDLDAGLARWGLTRTSRHWAQTRKVNDRNETTWYLEVQISTPTEIDASAHFRQETSFDRARQWFKKTELQAGDDLFDRAVFVTEPTGAHLRDVLADEGVQSAIMELCTRGGVRLGPGWVRLRRSSSTAAPAMADHATPLALLAVHLESWARLS